ncbi:MAG: hypothetical protein JWO95_2700 [Verrucomicrobiales bacterium]|nr:hypothetical protein [Verrucomicrobiales bacterium]
MSNRLMERSAKEITLFAITAFGVWCAVWAILLTNGWLGAFSLLLIAIGLGSFACAAKNNP